jgi:hypothetical protein
MGWTTGVQFPAGAGMGFYLIATASISALGPIQPPVEWVTWALTPRVKRPERETDHLPPSGAEFKNVWQYTSAPLIRLHGVVLS